MSVRGSEGTGTSGPETKERRTSAGQRVSFEALVAVGEGAGGGFEAESVDVSPEGMRLRTAYLPEVGDKLVCRFDGLGVEVVAECEVAWRHEEAKGGEFGLRFVSLDPQASEAVRKMCSPTAGNDEPAEAAAVPRGSRVRLHIEGLGSPMKARVRDAAPRQIEVGSNLEFLKVGRSLEVEDVEAGKRREAHIDNVKVDVDPATNVPQLVVTLRYEGAPEGEEKPREGTKSIVPPTRRASTTVTSAGVTAKGDKTRAPESRAAKEAKEAAEAEEAARDDGAEAGGEGDENAEADGEGNDFGSKAKNAGRAVAGKLGPALAGAGAKAKGAAESVMALLKRRKAEKAEAEKAAQPRRTTAPAPGGGLKAEGKRLVRDDSGEDEDEAPPPPKTNRKAAAMGGALGLVAVLAIFGLTRFLGGRGGEKAQADRSTAALPAASVDASAGGPAGLAGVPTANVPLFGQTPLSTTEPAAAPPPSGSAVAAAPPAGGDDNGGSGEDSPPGDNGQILKEWGKGTVTKPKTLTFKMDGPIERITGAAGAAGFTITVPGHKSAVPSSDLTKKDNRLQSVDVVNGSRGAEISLKFKDGVPSGYLAKIKGDKLQIQLGTEPHSKVAKAKKGKKKPRD